MSVVPTLQRSFQQHPLAQFVALQSAEPLLLALLLAEPLAELLALAPVVSPWPPPEKPSSSLPVAHPMMAKHEIQTKGNIFIWVPWGLRRC